MKILSENNDRKERDVDRLELLIDEKKYTITESFGHLKVHSHSDRISVHPCVANEVTIDSTEI